ncbi:MAG: Gldg family protein [Polyangiales bacterium]
MSATPRHTRACSPDAAALGPDARQLGRWVRARAAWMLGLSLLLFVAVQWLSLRHAPRFDWSPAGRQSLRRESVALLRRLQRPVHIHVLLSPLEASHARLQSLLRVYRRHSRKLYLHFVDPDSQAGALLLLAQRFGVGQAIDDAHPELAELAAIVHRGRRAWLLSRDRLFGAGHKASVDELAYAEEALTEAIAAVVRTRETRICLVQGHGEWSLDTAAVRHLEAARQALLRDNFKLTPVRLTQVHVRPCAALLLLGPQRRLPAADVRVLDAYAKQGGALLLAIDPRLRRDRMQPTGLRAWAEAKGLRLDDTVVQAQSKQMRVHEDDATHFWVEDWGAHPSLRSLRDAGGRVSWLLGRSVRLLRPGCGRTLLRSAANSVAKAYPAAVAVSRAPAPTAQRAMRAPATQNVPGPVSLAVAFDAQSCPGWRAGRLIVAGDSDWLRPGPPAAANHRLLRGWVAWLAARPTLLSLSPRAAPARPVPMTAGDLDALLWRVVLWLPLSVVLLGLGVYGRRRASPAVPDA